MINVEDDLYIIDCGKYLTIVNGNGKKSNHCHINKGHKKKQYKAAHTLIDLIEKKKVPRSRYFRQSALRVSLDKKYKRDIKHKMSKDHNKQTYYNVGGGKR